MNLKNSLIIPLCEANAQELALACGNAPTSVSTSKAQITDIGWPSVTLTGECFQGREGEANITLKNVDCDYGPNI